MMKRAMTAVCVCVPMSAMAQSEQLSGRALGEFVPGATIQIDAPFGYKLPIRYGVDGTLAGEAGDLSSYLGSATDTGRWWLKGDQICHKWSRWLNSEPQCMRLRKDGRTLHWTNQDGNTGTATYTAAPPRPAVVGLPAQAPVTPKLLVTVPEAQSGESPPLADRSPALRETAPQSVEPAQQPLRIARAPQPLPAPPMASQPAAAARTTSSPPMTASDFIAQPQLALFVVANVRENDVLNIRSGPSTDYDVVAALKPGSRGVAIVGDCQSEWCPVRHQTGAGWVNKLFLANQEPSALTEASARVPAREAAAVPAPAKMPITAFRDPSFAPRTCLTAAARALLQTIETKFGAVRLVSTCRSGATIAGTGRPSRHASGNAVDFDAGSRKDEILRWLIANHRSGGTMTYPEMDHIHVDIGPHFVSIAGGQQSASWRSNRGSSSTASDDED